ncbi:XylR family transcriptional regulator [Bacillus safensis]|uniref:transcriptional repressor XylR n=1 Tax=Bacillus TaxID=1386 RepID=UPI00094BCAD7|nr:ROK family transcriptional regulator [Bacillus safensis]APT49847.1 XylR family transcriptional regulator [Bacillus safensis]APT53877.1 XylR family transcriptional regulator [Bacillus safensis]
MDIADQNFVKKINQKLLLKEILQHAPISRAKLSERTGLNKSTVSSQVSTLMKEHLVYEIGQGESSGGRRPVLLMFNKRAGCSIGIDVGVDYVNGILTDLEGSILYEEQIKLPPSSPDVTIRKLIELIQQLITQMPSSPYGLIGIGLCIHGLVDTGEKIVFTPHSKWKNVDLKTTLQDTFKVPIFIENEANAGAYGEKIFGAAKHYDHLIYASIGTGIGIGIIINHHLYRGAYGFSGEMGHMTIDFNGPTCSCGNRGCWELYASEKALFQSLQTDGQHISHQELEQLAKLNDMRTLNALRNFGFYLGVGLTNVLHTFNPQAIILRNKVIESHQTVLHVIGEEVSSRMDTQFSSQVELLPSSLGHNAPVLGMTSLVIEAFLQDATLTT